MNLIYLLIFSPLYLISFLILILIYQSSFYVTRVYLELIGMENQNLLKLKTIMAFRIIYTLSLFSIFVFSFIYLSMF